MHAAQNTAQRGVGDETQAVVSLAGTCYIGTGERNSGDDLYKKSRQRGAAEHIKPSRFPGIRNRMQKGRAECIGSTGNVVEPRPEAFEETHRRLHLTR